MHDDEIDSDVSVVRVTLFCKHCGDQAPQSSSCVTCGGTLNRHTEMAIRSTLSQVHEMLGGKVRRSGFKKPVLEFKGGDSRSADGSWATIEQVVDRVKNWYRKKVVLADGTVSKDREGPLTDQSLHGPQP